MNVAIDQREAAVWFTEGQPARMVWRGSRWRVLDTPTRIGLHQDAIYSPLVTHPPAPWAGWRFIARSDEGIQTYVFDVRETAHDGFEVLNVYE